MNTLFLKMYIKAQDLMHRDEGQDLVEYALLVALISLGAIATIGGITTQVKNIFISISTTLATA